MPLYRTKALTGANNAGKIVLKFAAPNKKYRYKNVTQFTLRPKAVLESNAKGPDLKVEPKI